MVTAARLRKYTVDIDSRSRGGTLVRTLDSVDLDVDSGRVTALVGESGCGKSLVAAALCGLLPPGSHTTGTLDIAGRAVPTEADWRLLRGHRIGLIPQSPATSFTPVRTVGSQLAEVVRTLGSRNTLSELLDRVALPPSNARLYPHELSGGMAQRAAIAAALAGSPDLVIADEPTSALDPALAEQVWALLSDMAADGRAVLIVTHDLTSMMRSGTCGSIAVMRAGTTVLQATPATVLSHDDDYVRALFVGVTI
ncbi:ABC transporter ATP-binding protein [Rhodococcus sp. 06-418-5]|nr:ATP-binding cassette domain-containing protein [Rhodococcus sp. 06-418-5]OZC76942.1 ABC transporter ATP-binding protein [Rhodococcus sp. 06-418-5]